MTTEEILELAKALGADKPRFQQNITFNGPVGQQISHVDKIEAHFDKDMQMQITNALSDGDTTETVAAEVDDALITELMPVFKKNRAEAVAFVRAVDGLKPTAVTEKVNELLRKEKITKSGCKGDLWGVLHEYGLYKCGKSTWNSQVNG